MNVVNLECAARKLRIAVMGLAIRFPLVGMAWHHLHYVLGLKRLGFDVVYLEDSSDYPNCYDPSRFVTDVDPTYGLNFIAHTFDLLGIAERWAYFDAHTNRWCGPSAADGRYPPNVDMIINVSLSNTLGEWSLAVPHRVALDTDPVFNQVRHLTLSTWRAHNAEHTHFLTFGELFGLPDAGVPDDGFPWVATRQPIVLSQWPVARQTHNERFTTVMQWDSYPPREFGGQQYGMKSASFNDYLSLPRSVTPELEIAVGSPHAPRSLLLHHGWQLVDPQQVTVDVQTDRNYVQNSQGEFSVSKHGYVVGNSGWFSERSTTYLASGRPVITQDTGFSRVLPTGEGLMAFSNADEAAAAIESVCANYERHRRAAREIAEAFFDSDKVLTRLLADTLGEP